MSQFTINIRQIKSAEKAWSLSTPQHIQLGGNTNLKGCR